MSSLPDAERVGAAMKELSKVSDFELRKELRRRNKLRRKLSRKSKGLAARKGTGCRLSDRDETKKKSRDYVEAGSYVRRDGSERLVGRDWAERKAQLWQRSGGLCENATPIAIGEFERCLNLADDAHHKIKRSIRRDDRLSNLINLCREHHQALDPHKIRSGKDGATK